MGKNCLNAPLKLVITALRSNFGHIQYENSGYYWTSDYKTPILNYCFKFDNYEDPDGSGDISLGGIPRSKGATIRCVNDTPVPTE